MTTAPKNADKMTDTQLAVWQMVFEEFLMRQPQVSVYKHVTAGDIADRVVEILSNNRGHKA